MRNRSWIWVLVLAALALAVSCAQQTESPGEAAEAEAPVEPPTLVVTEAMQAKLAAADLVDGTEDQVIAGCPGCGLAMDGKQELALTVGDHEIWFCSQHCRDAFAENVAEAVLAMAVPEEAPAPTGEQ